MRVSDAPRHSWHLTRCTSCRHFVINSAPKCPYCGAWRTSARVISFALPVMAAVVGIAVLFLLAQGASKVEKIQAEERAVMLQNLAANAR